MLLRWSKEAASTFFNQWPPGMDPIAGFNALRIVKKERCRGVNHLKMLSIFRCGVFNAQSEGFEDARPQPSSNWSRVRAPSFDGDGFLFPMHHFGDGV